MVLLSTVWVHCVVLIAVLRVYCLVKRASGMPVMHAPSSTVPVSLGFCWYAGWCCCPLCGADRCSTRVGVRSEVCGLVFAARCVYVLDVALKPPTRHSGRFGYLLTRWPIHNAANEPTRTSRSRYLGVPRLQRAKFCGI